MLHRNGPVDYKIWGVVQQCVYGTKICDIYDLQKCLTQTLVDIEQNVIEAAIDQWRDRLRSCVLVGDTLNTCCEIIVYFYCVFHQRWVKFITSHVLFFSKSNSENGIKIC